MKRKFFRKAKAILLPTIAFPAVALAQWNPSTAGSSSRLPQNSVYSIISGIMMWLLAIFAFVAIIGFVISGIMYLVAAGDDDMQKKAKNQMMWSITGVIVGLVGLVAIYAIDNMLSGAYNYI